MQPYYFDSSFLQALLKQDQSAKLLLDALVQVGHSLLLSPLDIDLWQELPALQEQCKIISITGKDARATLSSSQPKYSISFNAILRVAPAAKIITFTPELVPQSLQTFTPEEALLGLKEKGGNQIQMLNLQAEYLHQMEDIDPAISGLMSSARYVLGPQVQELEKEIAKKVNSHFAIGVSSGTEALVLSLRALAIVRKQRQYFTRTEKILAPTFTFTATGDAILRSGATPVFIDLDPETLNIDTKAIRKYLQENPEDVVGIIPVHLYGGSCQMEELLSLAKEFNLFIVEDTAQGFNGKWKDQYLGTIGDIGTYSFFPTKNLGAMGDAGMIVTNDPDLDSCIRMLIKHGGKDKYNVMHVGYNARLDTMQAAILLERLKYIDGYTQKRQQLAQDYMRGLQGLPLQLPTTCTENVEHVYHQFTMQVAAEIRDELKAYLHEAGIQSMIYYPFCLHDMEVFRNHPMEIDGTLQNSIKATFSVLSLPMEPLQTSVQTEYIIATIIQYFKTKEL